MKSPLTDAELAELRTWLARQDRRYGAGFTGSAIARLVATVDALRKQPAGPGLFGETLDPREAAIATLTTERDAWRDFVFVIGEAVGCLASSFPDGNDHIVRKIRALIPH